MRPIVIVEKFNPDEESMQDALDWLMRKEVKKVDKRENPEREA